MIKRISTGKTISVTAIAVVALIAAFAIVLVNRAGGEASPSELPSMTLGYEVYGPAVTVGQNAVDPYKETRRLEYRSKSDWTETVIESPTIDLGRYGSGSNVGSYRTLKGRVLTEYDPLDGSAEESTIDEGVTHIPHAAFMFVHTSPVKPLGNVQGLSIATEAKICFNSECEENAGGVKYSANGVNLVVLEGDNWIIPLEFGNGFVLRSANIQAPRP